MVARYWCLRTDRSQKKYIWDELEENRLRQGWGYAPRLDLRCIREKKKSGQALDEEEQRTWRGNRRLHPDEPGGMTQGDLVLLPNLPIEGRWTLVEILDDGYEYAISPDHGDYGHIRHVRIVSANIHPHAPSVSAKLRGTMRSQSRLWSVDRYQEEIKRLIEAIESGENVDVPASEDDHLLTMHNVLRDHFWNELSQRFRGPDFEGPMKRVLEQIYSGDIEHRGGPNEKGADLICNFTDELGVPYAIAVQIKMWEGEGDLSGAFDQLRTACQEYENVSAGIVLTTLQSLKEGTEESREKLARELGRPILILLRDEVLDMFLRHMPDLVGSLEA